MLEAIRTVGTYTSTGALQRFLERLSAVESLNLACAPRAPHNREIRRFSGVLPRLWATNRKDCQGRSPNGPTVLVSSIGEET